MMSQFFAFLFGDFCKEKKMLVGEKKGFREGDGLMGFRGVEFRFNDIICRRESQG